VPCAHRVRRLAAPVRRLAAPVVVLGARMARERLPEVRVGDAREKVGGHVGEGTPGPVAGSNPEFVDAVPGEVEHSAYRVIVRMIRYYPTLHRKSVLPATVFAPTIVRSAVMFHGDSQIVSVRMRQAQP
jgi:hypothetical protein